ncbi:MAG TPA: EMC3/TMCO1 family protein [Candidatus Baltobacteraceae bacterium]|nr:EMC3/TMCO1 family protein [Candidatus Baltobacteraceae bacterium]
MGLIPVITLPMNAEIIIVGVGICYTMLTIVIQRKLTNPKKLREIQGRMKDLTKEMNEMAKANATKEQIAAKQSQLMPLMGESMRAQLKSMFVLLPMFVLFYYLLVPNLPLGVTDATASIKTLFFYTVFGFGMVMLVVTTLYDRRKARIDKLQAQTIQ